MIELRIERATEISHVQAMIEIDRLTFQDCSYDATYLSENVLNERYPAWVAWLDDAPAGFICLMEVQNLHYHACWVDLVAVIPEHSNRGIARALIGVAEAHGRTIGAEFISALVRKDNHSSLKAFEKQNFKSVTGGFELMIHDLDDDGE